MSDNKGYLVPARRDPKTGKLQWAVPGIVDDLVGAVTLPGEVYRGEVDPLGDEAQQRAFDLAGMASLGTIGPLGRGNGMLASRSARIYNPPEKPPRPIEADYPRGVPVDDAGRITHDIEGRPLVAKHVVGRERLGGVLGGRDQALSPEAGDYVSVSKGSIGRAPEARPASLLPPKAVGVFEDFRGLDGPDRHIGVLRTLDQASSDKVTAHELGHTIDTLSSNIGSKGLMSELRTVYNDLNNHDLAAARARFGPDVDPGGRAVYRGYTPQIQGYSGSDVPREYMAEAIRAYMADPNYMKTVAPKTAAAIRAAVNENPRLKDTIQFNSGSPVVVGAAALAPDKVQGGTMTPEQQRALAIARARRRRAELQGGGASAPGTAPQAASSRDPSMADSAALGALDTVTAGFADEIGSGLDWVADRILPGGQSRSYEELLSLNRGQQKAAQETNPGSYMTGQIGGGVIGGLGLARGGLSMAANAAQRGAGLGRVSAMSAADGLLLGGAHGAGSGEGVEGRVAGAMIGGAGGAALGVAAPAVVAASGHAIRAGTAPLLARLNPQPYARRALGQTIDRSGRSVDDIVNELVRARADNQPMFTMADAMGHAGGRQLSAVTRTPNDARQGVVDALNHRQSGQGDRLSNFLSEGFDAPDTAAMRTRTLTDARTSEANAAYAAARQDAGPVNVSPVIAAIDETLSPGASGMASPRDRIAPDTIEGALARVRSMLTDGKSNVSDFNSLFRIKLDLDDAIARSDAQGAGNRAHALANIQRQIDGALAKASPTYAAARDQFASNSRRIDAVGEGAAAASGRTRAEDNIGRFQSMMPEEQSAFRAGYADPMIARVESMSMSPTTNKARPLLSAKTSAEFPAFAAPGQGELLARRLGREQTMFETHSAALGGSRTADNLADNADLGQFDPGIVTSVATGRFGQAAMTAIAKALNEVKGTPPAVTNRVAQALMETSPTKAREALAASSAADQARRAKNARIMAALLGSGAAGAGRLSP